MPQQTEPSANNALGELLGKMLPGSVVRSEHTQAIVDHPGLQPDILVTAPGRSPVVLEAEYMPATNAEAEARSRLGLEVVDTGRRIESAVALRYPADLRTSDNLSESLTDATLSYCVVSEDEDRFPGSGWIEGSVGDLAELVRLVSVPQRAVDQAADALEKGIERAASILNQLHESRPDVMPAIAGLLGMADVIQTRRMAGAIIANAMVFHERLGGMHGVKPLSQLCSGSVASPKREILNAWTEILKINYWPIFAIAKDIVDQIPAGEAAQLLTGLRTTVEDVAATGANQAHDLTGRIFQRLIADRKYLATFYTLPSSAALLARLAVAKLCLDGRRDGIRLVRRRRRREAAHRRLRVRHRRAAVRRVRPDRRPSRAGRRRPRRAASGHDGGGAVRLRRDAVRDPHHRLDPLRRAADGQVRQVAAVHARIWKAGRRDGPHRLPGAPPVLGDDDPVQHGRPRAPHRQRRRGDRRAGGSGDTGRGLRPGNHEPAVYARPRITRALTPT